MCGSPLIIFKTKAHCQFISNIYSRFSKSFSIRKLSIHSSHCQYIYILRIASSEVQVLALGLHSSNTSWCWNELTLQASQSPSGWHLILQFGVMHKPTEGALNLTMYVINEYTKGPQYGPLEYTICYQFSFGHFLNVAVLWEIEVLSLLTQYLHTALLILQHNVDLSMSLYCTHMSFSVWESSFSVKI